MEIINEIHQRMKEYSVGCDYVPLKISIKVKPPIYLNNPFIHFDGLISYLCFREAVNELFYNLPTESTIDISNLQLPIKQTNDVYHASVGIYGDNLRLYRDKLYKRFTDKETYKLTHRQQKGRIKTNQGHFKDFMINMPMLITNHITFYANADKNEIKRLLHHLTHIGKKTSIGSGKIFKITITETDEDYSFFKNGNIMRAIPSSFKLPILPGMTFQKATYKPPYWDSTKATMCIVPRNQIKEVILNGKNI